MQYNQTNVPPKGSPNEPQLDAFTRQASTDYFTEWKYNDVIDNLELFLKQYYPFYVSGCNITYAGNNEYNITAGLVYCGTLVYFAGGTFSVPDDDVYVVRITKDGGIATIKFSLYDYISDVGNRLCKVGYVCKGTVMPVYRPQMLDVLQDLPNTEVYYGKLNFYGANGRYG